MGQQDKCMWTDRQDDSYIPPNFVCQGNNNDTERINGQVLLHVPDLRSNIIICLFAVPLLVILKCRTEGRINFFIIDNQI